MTIQVNILNHGEGIEFILQGVVYGEEIIKVHLETHTPAFVTGLKYKIVDKSAVTKNYMSTNEIRKIANLDKRVAEINPDIITAIVSPNETIKLTTDLWEAYLHDRFTHLKTFHDRATADKWLEETLKLNEIK